MLATLGRFRGKSYKVRLLNPRDEFWDRRLGVRTFGFHPAMGGPGDDDWRVHYTPTPYSDIFRLLRMVDLRSDDVFVDLGAGLGRAVFAASWLGARRAVGVEVVQDLCDKATQNHQQSRLASRDIKFICTNAQNYQNADTTVLFMFHPFGEATLRHVLRNIESVRMEGSHRTLRIIYVNPIYDAVLQQMRWLKCIGRVPAVQSWLSTTNHYDSTLWQSC
jgi:SAM-dependent methyltransferase